MNGSLPAAVLLSMLVACGPLAIGAGIREVVRDKDQVTVFLFFVNQGNETVLLRLLGTDRDGQPIERASDPIAPGQRGRVQVPATRALRVRATEVSTLPASVPARWDFAVEDPLDGSEMTLGVDPVVLASLRPTSSRGEALVLDKLDGEPSTATFTRVASGEFASEPDRVAVHPGGCYVYGLRDLGSGQAEFTAYRVDTGLGLLVAIQSEFGMQTVNPRGFEYSGSFDDLDIEVDPRGRALYVIERLPANTLTVLHHLPVLEDGSLGAAEASVRGLIGDLSIRPDGRRLYLTENLDDGAGFVLRDFALDAEGRIEFAAGQALMPCVSTAGGQVALHPNGQVLYVAFTDGASSRVKIGAYAVGSNGGLFQLNRDCDGFETVDDLEVDPSGRTLYASGTAVGGARRLLRYALDPRTGALDGLLEQDLGQVSRLTTTEDRNRASGDPLRQLVYVAIDDRLVPHVRQPDGGLSALPGGIGLDYGAPSSTRLLRGLRRGTVAVQGARIGSP